MEKDMFGVSRLKVNLHMHTTLSDGSKTPEEAAEIYKKAGYSNLNEVCRKIKTPLNDGDAVITPAFDIKNANSILFFSILLII